jgi:hypothetical protein
MHDHNATGSVDQLVAACHRLLSRERQSCYPGGTERRFDRQVILGGFLLFLARRTWQARGYRESIDLVVDGRRAAGAAIARRCLRALRRRRPASIL